VLGTRAAEGLARGRPLLAVESREELVRRDAFAFAVQAAPARHGSDWAGVARDAEDLGYRALLVPDHQGSGGPIVSMAIAGAATTSLRVGTLMLAVDMHNPVVLAQELVSLDAMLGGRLEIGLGAGWMARDYERTGVRMDPIGERIERLREFANVLRELWAGEPVDHDGPRYRFSGAVVAPVPHSATPTLVLGGGGRRMLELAVEVADIVNLGAAMIAGSKDAPLGDSAGMVAFERRLDWVEAAARRWGCRPRVQCLAYETYIAADARNHAEKRVSRSFGLATDELMRSPLALLGTVEELCEKIERLRERLAISYWVVKGPSMRDFAPVVERLAGR
jgi:probable F420-dependent oxidoreductase